jgi:murein DD-endopeptidase MepM/ murein hydrolase activator NlpD
MMTITGAVGRAEAQEDLVRVWGERNDKDGYDFYAESNHIVETYLTVDFKRIVNLSSQVEFPYHTMLDAGVEKEYLFTLELKDPSKRRGYSISYSFARGDPSTAEHDDSYRYLFPFEHGTKHRVTQGYEGEFTHFGENKFAIDFDLDIGTPVYAARDGLVVEVKEDSRVGGRSARYGDEGNYILVAHEDGSFAHYVHLEPGGSIVEPGDRVEAGEHIGYSGNTGRSAGPHLHFDVRVPLPDGTMQSIPTVFRSHTGEAVTPRQGRYYYASHPDGAPFEAVFGRELRHDDFADHSKQVPVSREISFRTEQVDSTYIAYVRNGYDRAVNVTMTVSGSGVRTTAELPVTMRLPPRTERFFTLVRPVPQARSVRYSLQVIEAKLAPE